MVRREAVGGATRADRRCAGPFGGKATRAARCARQRRCGAASRSGQEGWAGAVACSRRRSLTAHSDLRRPRPAKRAVARGAAIAAK